MLYKNRIGKGFPGGTVGENPPANVWDTGSIPGLGRFHMLQSNQVLVPQLLSLCSRTHQPQLLKPMCRTLVLRNKRSRLNEKPAQLQRRLPFAATRENCVQQRRPKPRCK